MHGHVGVVRILLRAGANSNVESTDGKRGTPLHLASGKGHLAVVEALIEAGANVNHDIVATCSTSLMIPAKSGHIDIVHRSSSSYALFSQRERIPALRLLRLALTMA